MQVEMKVDLGDLEDEFRGSVSEFIATEFVQYARRHLMESIRSDPRYQELIERYKVGAFAAMEKVLGDL